MNNQEILNTLKAKIATMENELSEIKELVCQIEFDTVDNVNNEMVTKTAEIQGTVAETFEFIGSHNLEYELGDMLKFIQDVRYTTLSRIANKFSELSQEEVCYLIVDCIREEFVVVSANGNVECLEYVDRK